MSKKSKDNDKIKKILFSVTGTVVVSALVAATASNIGFTGVDFDPGKYSKTMPKKEDDIVFDGVAYSSDRNSRTQKQKKTEDTNNGDKKNNSENKPVNSQVYENTSTPIVSANINNNSAETFDSASIDAVESGGGSGGFLPVISDNPNGNIAVSEKKDVTSADGSGSDDKKGSTSSSVPTKKPTAENKDTAKADSDKPQNKNDVPTKKPSSGGGNGGGNSGGNVTPPSPENPTNPNPSNSDTEAPSRDDDIAPKPDNGGNSGSHGGNYSGQPIGLEYSGNFFDLSVGQNTDSMFLSCFNRKIFLMFTNGSMTLKSANISVAGLDLSQINTNKAHSSNANIKFTYETKDYNIEIPYSVTQWKADIYMPDGTKFPNTFTPDSTLTINLSRYYTALRARYPKFIGWRCEGIDEIYTQKCVMTKPYMELIACVSGEIPKSDEVGEEYILDGMTDIDLSEFNVYPNCKKLIIGKSVHNFSAEKLADKFPNLEEFVVNGENTVYSEYDGVLYKNNTIISVPPKKTEIEIADGTLKLGDYAFYHSEIKDVALPKTLSEIGSFAFLDAKLDSLTINADKYSVGESAFFSSDADTAAVKTIISNTLYTADISDGAENFGEALPSIVLPDSKYDRVYQYYLSSWGCKADKKYGAGTAQKIFSTPTGAQDRNVLIDDAVYSFFDGVGSYTLTSVSTDCGSTFKTDENTVAIAADAFYGCTNITTFIFNEKLKSVDDDMLRGVGSISSLTFKAHPPKISKKFFESLSDKNIKIYVPADSYDEYMREWGGMIDDVLGEDSAKNIIDMDSDTFELIDGARYIHNETGLTLVRVTDSAAADFIPADGTTKIADHAFDTNLDSLIIPQSIIEISEEPISENGSIGSVFVNSDIDFKSAFKGSRLFVTDSSSYSGNDAYVYSGIYAPNSDGTICTEKSLLYIPKNIEGEFETGENITDIFDGAAMGCTKITSVVLSDNLERIGADAFYGCHRIKEIKTSDSSSLKEIGPRAFYQCTLITNLVLPNSTEIIGESAFYGCDRLESISSDGIRIIGDYAFMKCNSLYRFNSLSVMNLSDSIEDIGKGAFSSCPLIKEVILPTNLEEIKESTFENCIGLYILTNWGNTRIIGKDAFRSCGFISVSLPANSGLELESGSFADCPSLDNIVFADGIKRIAPDFVEDGAGVLTAFHTINAKPAEADFDEMIRTGRIYNTVYVSLNVDLSGLLDESHICRSESGIAVSTYDPGLYFTDRTSRTVLKKVSKKCINYKMIRLTEYMEIDNDAFSEAEDLETVVLGRNSGELPDYLFAGKEKLRSCSFISNSVSSGTLTLGERMFKDCTSLESIDIPSNIVGMKNGVFENCVALKSVVWGAKYPSVPDDMFSGCTSLSSFKVYVTGLQSVESIGKRAFKGCSSLESIDGLGGGGFIFPILKSIDDYAFDGCESLATMAIGPTVTSLGSNIFENCTNLTNINILGEPFEIGSFVLGSSIDNKYFMLGKVSDEIYDMFLSSWGGRLSADYGDTDIEKIIVRESDNSDDDPGDNPSDTPGENKHDPGDSDITVPISDEPSEDVSDTGSFGANVPDEDKTDADIPGTDVSGGNTSSDETPNPNESANEETNTDIAAETNPTTEDKNNVSDTADKETAAEDITPSTQKSEEENSNGN